MVCGRSLQFSAPNTSEFQNKPAVLCIRVIEVNSLHFTASMIAPVDWLPAP